LPAETYGEISIYCSTLKQTDLRYARKGLCSINQSVICTCTSLTSATRYDVILTNTKAGFTTRETRVGLIYTSKFLAKAYCITTFIFEK
jgi:hypothetical protein